MRREYEINPNEWDLLFYAPLKTDTVDVISGCAGVLDSRCNPYFDSKGFHFQYYNQNEVAAVNWNNTYVPPVNFSEYNEFITKFDVNWSYVRSVGAPVFVLPYNYIAYCKASYNSQTTQYGIPLNTDATIFVHTTMTPTVATLSISNNLNDFGWTYMTSANYNGTDIRVGTSWGKNNGATGYTTEFKVFGKKGARQ